MTTLKLPIFWVTCSCGKRTPDLNLSLQTNEKEQYIFEKKVACLCGNEINVIIEATVKSHEGKTFLTKFNARTV